MYEPPKVGFLASISHKPQQNLQPEGLKSSLARINLNFVGINLVDLVTFCWKTTGEKAQSVVWKDWTLYQQITPCDKYNHILYKSYRILSYIYNVIYTTYNYINYISERKRDIVRTYIKFTMLVQTHVYHLGCWYPCYHTCCCRLCTLESLAQSGPGGPEEPLVDLCRAWYSLWIFWHWNLQDHL